MKRVAMIGAALAALSAGQTLSQVVTIEPAQRTRIKE
jgi:hypothetical protein